MQTVYAMIVDGYRKKMSIQGRPCERWRNFISDWSCFLKDWVRYEAIYRAPDFGVWIHVENRCVLCYAEGDIILRAAKDHEGLLAAVKILEDFYDVPEPDRITNYEFIHDELTWFGPLDH